jgi:hypothetical protein
VDIEEEAGKVLMKSAEVLVNKHKDDYNLQAEQIDHILHEVEKTYPIQKIGNFDLALNLWLKCAFKVLL